MPATSNPAPIDWEALAARALEQRGRAYAPYSGFRVGAALLTSDGRVFTGSNVENRSFGLTLCAERVALAQAVAAGATDLAALAVATGADPPASPCGLCRESLAEFSTRLPILLINTTGERVECDLAELLPRPFRLSAPVEAGGVGEEM